MKVFPRRPKLNREEKMFVTEIVSISDVFIFHYVYRYSSRELLLLKIFVFTSDTFFKTRAHLDRNSDTGVTSF